MSDFELGYLAATVLALLLSIPHALVWLAIGWVEGDKIFNNKKTKSGKKRAKKGEINDGYKSR